MTLHQSTTAKASVRANNPADEGWLVEMDLHRLDCAVDALRGADLSTHREALRRIADNFTDLMENPDGHAH